MRTIKGRDALAVFLMYLGLASQLAAADDEQLVIGFEALQGRLADPAALVEDVRASGEAKPVLQIGDAVVRSVQWHPSIAQAIGNLLSQREQVEVARAGYFPQVNGGFQTGYNSGYSGNGFSPSFVLSASQMLYDFGKVSSSVRSSEAAVVERQANVLLRIDEVAMEAAQALVEVQRYQNLQRIAEDQIAGLQAVADLARERSEKGASSRSDVVQSLSRVEGAKAYRQQQVAELERWRSALATLLGWLELKAVSDDFPEPLHDVCADDRLDDRLLPSVLAAQARHSQARASLENARAQELPTISLDPSATRYFNDNHAAAGSDPDRTQYGVFVSVNMPLYQGGALSAQRRAASHALASSDAAMRDARLQARRSLLEARSRSFSLRSNLAVLQQHFNLSSQTRDLYYQQYLQLGTRPLLDLLNAEQEIHQSRIDWQGIISDIRQLQLTCIFSSGGMRAAFALERSRVQGVELRP